MRFVYTFPVLLGLCLLWTDYLFAEEYSVVVSISDYKIDPDKHDEISDPDIYFQMVHNGTVIETSDIVRDSNFHSYGEMRRFGDYCQGISELLPEDTLVIKFYDSDYDTGLVKQFWEWVQGSLYKYIVYFERQVELMNDSKTKYDDYDAYKAAKDDPKLNKAEDKLTDNIMKINNKRNNKQEHEYLGEVTVTIKQITEGFSSGGSQHASGYEIINTATNKSVGKINLIIKRFEGYGSKYKTKGF
ncbi:MAG: hypothetical protein MRK02_15620 [Candidatus Scalindua sp.]|nr:hypothetical protein [Candidatus Scalindua sp.]